MRFTQLIACAGTLLMSVPALAQRISREEYILKYQNYAIETMDRYGIPASICMAQALLESDNGNSRLAKQANNHFGIKCRGDWQGETIGHTDDAQNECFRKYDSPEDSYLDYGRFLDNSQRYDFLFEYEPHDYESWAYGLKQAGYATNPNYPTMLIKIIEDNQLYRLDRSTTLARVDLERKTETVVPAPDENTESVINVDNYTVTIDRSSGREIQYNNGVPFVVTREGDTFSSLSREFRISIKKLLKFNDLNHEIALRQGNALYIRKKNKRSENGHLFYVVKENDTMHSISQQFGIQQKFLYRINNMSTHDTIREGQQIRLR